MWDITEAIAYYKRQGAPSDQNALTALLKEVQQENGGSVPAYSVAAMAEQLQVKESYLLAIIKRIPSLRLQDTHLLEADRACGPGGKTLQGKSQSYLEIYPVHAYVRQRAEPEI